MKNKILLPLFAVFTGLTGCVRNYHEPPPVYVFDAPPNPNWTPAKEQKLQDLTRQLDQMRADLAKSQLATSPGVTEAELNALKQENARKREKLSFLIGEINALLVERGNKPLPYTSNAP